MIGFLKWKNPTYVINSCNIITQNILSGNWFAKDILNNICTCFPPCTFHIQARSVMFVSLHMGL